MWTLPLSVSEKCLKLSLLQTRNPDDILFLSPEYFPQCNKSPGLHVFIHLLGKLSLSSPKISNSLSPSFPPLLSNVPDPAYSLRSIQWPFRPLLSHPLLSNPSQGHWHPGTSRREKFQVLLSIVSSGYGTFLLDFSRMNAGSVTQ